MRLVQSKSKAEVVRRGGITARIYPSDSGGYSSFLIRYFVDGKPKSLRAKTIEEARARARDKLREVSAGTVHVETFTPKQAANIAAAVSKLQAINIPLLDAVSEFVAAYKKLGDEGTITDAVQYFIADKERRALTPIDVPALVDLFITKKKAEGVSSLYLDDIERRLERLKSSFRVPVLNVTADALSSWMESMGATGRNANNYRNAVCTLFSFARERGYLPRDKKTEAERILRVKEAAQDEVGIYSPNDIRLLLEATSGPMQAAISIGAFAGLRNSEIMRLEWHEVDLKTRHILVPASKAKTAQRRLVPILPNLAAWLEPLAKSEGPVAPVLKNLTNLSRNISAACERAEIAMVANGLRHSFASYRLAVVKSADQVALEMGNSPRKLFQNYRELVTEEAAQAWFAVTESTPLPSAPESEPQKP